MIRVDVETRPTAAKCLALLKRFAPRHSATPQPSIRSMEEEEDEVEYEEIAAQSPAKPGTSSTTAAPAPAPALAPAPTTPVDVKVRSVSVLAIDTPPSMPKPLVKAEEQEHEQMLRLARLHAKGKDVREKELLALQAKLRVKSTFKKNVSIYVLLDILHKYPEFFSRREKVFQSVTQTSKHWWGDHKAERTALRAKYGLE
jgi:hypothetical protein